MQGFLPGCAGFGQFCPISMGLATPPPCVKFSTLPYSTKFGEQYSRFIRTTTSEVTSTHITLSSTVFEYPQFNLNATQTPTQLSVHKFGRISSALTSPVALRPLENAINISFHQRAIHRRRAELHLPLNTFTPVNATDNCVKVALRRGA